MSRTFITITTASKLACRPFPSVLIPRRAGESRLPLSACLFPQFIQLPTSAVLKGDTQFDLPVW